MPYLNPPSSLRKKVNPDGAKSAGPLLHGWARRTSKGKGSTARHVRALASYLPTLSSDVYTALGGPETLEWATKALDTVGLEDTEAVTDAGEILVLGLPYGGPNGGKDSDEQFFSPLTDFLDGIIDTPPVMYTHGTQNGFEPEPIGSVKKRYYDRRGGWFKVQLDPSSPRYEQMLDAHNTNNLRASTGVVPASFSVAPSGHIDTWLVGELSLVDLREGWRPVNGYAITKATEVLFTDYYGDPVTEDVPMSIMDQLRESLTTLLKLVTGEEKQPIVGEPGIVEPFYKATDDDTEKCRPDISEESNKDITYLKTDEEPMADEIGKEKCEPCEAAKLEADKLKAELSAPVKCSRCVEAVNWVRGMVKAAKMSPQEAFTHLDTFSESDETFDAVKAEVEARTPLGLSKAAQASAQLQLLVPNSGGGDPQSTIDPEHMAKQRRLAGLPAKPIA